jgi:hypothetical protein
LCRKLKHAFIPGSTVYMVANNQWIGIFLSIQGFMVYDIHCEDWNLRDLGQVISLNNTFYSERYVQGCIKREQLIQEQLAQGSFQQEPNRMLNVPIVF